jgi:two-component system nitrate/nitrite response regulator NarL
MAILLVTRDKDVEDRCRRAASAEHMIEVVASVDALLDKLAATAPDVVLIDGEPLTKPIDRHIARLVTAAPAARVIVMTAAYNEDEEVALLRAGVKGCCRRGVDPDSLRQVLTATQGGVWVTSSLLPRLVRELQRFATQPVAQESSAAQSSAAAPKPDVISKLPKEKLATLTRREQDIVKLIAAGATNKQIATDLDISERTVKGHLSNVFQKLGIPDRLKLVLYLNGGR